MGLNLGNSNCQVNKISFYTFEDIDLQEFHGLHATKLHKRPSETLEADSIWSLEISIYCLPRRFNGLPLYFAQSSLQKLKIHLLSLKRALTQSY